MNRSVDQLRQRKPRSFGRSSSYDRAFHRNTFFAGGGEQLPLFRTPRAFSTASTGTLNPECPTSSSEIRHVDPDGLQRNADGRPCRRRFQPIETYELKDGSFRILADRGVWLCDPQGSTLILGGRWTEVQKLGFQISAGQGIQLWLEGDADGFGSEFHG